jgi:hypothetical protein
VGVLRDFSCKAHGTFESKDAKPKCPHGCNSIEPIFLKAPAVRTNGKTKRMDKTFDSLAKQFGLTDMSTRNGSVMNSIKPHSRPQHVQSSYDNLYAPLANAGMPNIQPRFALPNEVLPMLEPGNGRPFRGLDRLGDVFHERMGNRNVDPAFTLIEGATSKDDDAKLRNALQSGAVE